VSLVSTVSTKQSIEKTLTQTIVDPATGLVI
jgi:hypothetical protein